MRVDPDTNPEEVEVRLKPVFGVPPTTYLPVLYGVILLGALFLLLILPGIVNGGMLISFTSIPEHASIRVDGVYVGLTPGEYYVDAGEREIAIQRPGFAAEIQIVDVERRLLGSLFVPRRKALSTVLALPDIAALVSNGATDFAGWSLVGEASGQYQFPPVARPLARDLASAAGGEDAFDRFFDASLAQVASEAQLNDLIAASIAFDSGGGAASPAAIVSAIQRFAVVVDDHPQSAIQLAEVLSVDRRSALRETVVHRTAERLSGASGVVPLPDTIVGSLELFATIPFRAIAPGTATIGGDRLAARGGDISATVTLDRFYLSQSEITVGQFARFVADQPQWARENRDALVVQDLVDDQYLSDWGDTLPNEELPVRYVSVYAAEAFCLWLGDQVSDVGLTARLPSEAEWFFAAVLDAPDRSVLASADVGGPLEVGSVGAGKLGLTDMIGNVWEWTSDWFAPYSRLYGRTASDSAGAVPGAHRLIVGGSWASEPATFEPGDRGSSPPQWCSPFLGFRVALSER